MSAKQRSAEIITANAHAIILLSVERGTTAAETLFKQERQHPSLNLAKFFFFSSTSFNQPVSSKDVRLFPNVNISNPMTETHTFSESAIKNPDAEEYGNVINHMLASSLAGRSQLWIRRELLLTNQQSYFKPDSVLYRDTLKRDGRNGKELEYIHSTGSWLAQRISALELFKTSNDIAEQGRLLFLLE